MAYDSSFRDDRLQPRGTVLSINKTLIRAREDGLDVSEYSLRRWVRTGQIPSRQAGRTTLIFYPNLVRFITCADGSDILPRQEQTSGIRRIEV